jgi:hypothetical protein
VKNQEKEREKFLCGKTVWQYANVFAYPFLSISEICERHLDCELYGYYSSSMLYHRENNSRTKHVKQLRKIKFFSVQQRYRIIYSAMYVYIYNSGIRASVNCLCVFLEFEKYVQNCQYSFVQVAAPPPEKWYCCHT